MNEFGESPTEHRPKKKDDDGMGKEGAKATIKIKAKVHGKNPMARKQATLLAHNALRKLR